MDNKTFEMTLLFDFFGDLLTEKQQNCFDLYYNDDLSLSEIAEECGISRQGVRDNLLRAEAALKEYEEKTGVVRRFTEMQTEIQGLEESIRLFLANTAHCEHDASKILEKLEKLKG
ncbi:MAG: DNA-binding protein [Ruminococcaceae bacterium]|nr:DNA-binding protein [Oscillospiraceae bacterium]